MLDALGGMGGMPPEMGGMPPMPSDPAMPEASAEIAEQGRGGDSVLGHLTPGEVVIPLEMAKKYAVELETWFNEMDVSLDEFTVGGESNKTNPETGNAEFYFYKAGWEQGGGWQPNLMPKEYMAEKLLSHGYTQNNVDYFLKYHNPDNPAWRQDYTYYDLDNAVDAEELKAARDAWEEDNGGNVSSAWDTNLGKQFSPGSGSVNAGEDIWNRWQEREQAIREQFAEAGKFNMDQYSRDWRQRFIDHTEGATAARVETKNKNAAARAQLLAEENEFRMRAEAMQAEQKRRRQIDREKYLREAQSQQRLSLLEEMKEATKQDTIELGEGQVGYKSKSKPTLDITGLSLGTPSQPRPS